MTGVNCKSKNSIHTATSHRLGAHFLLVLPAERRPLFTSLLSPPLTDWSLTISASDWSRLSCLAGRFSQNITLFLSIDELRFLYPIPPTYHSTPRKAVLHTMLNVCCPSLINTPLTVLYNTSTPFILSFFCLFDDGQERLPSTHLASDEQQTTPNPSLPVHRLWRRVWDGLEIPKFY